MRLGGGRAGAALQGVRGRYSLLGGEVPLKIHVNRAIVEQNLEEF